MGLYGRIDEHGSEKRKRGRRRTPEGLRDRSNLVRRVLLERSGDDGAGETDDGGVGSRLKGDDDEAAEKAVGLLVEAGNSAVEGDGEGDGDEDVGCCARPEPHRFGSEVADWAFSSVDDEEADAGEEAGAGEGEEDDARRDGDEAVADRP